MSGCLTVMLCLSLLLSGCAPAESEGENSLLPPEVVEAFQPEPLGTGEITYETGAESLSVDQEALLLDYFTRSYEALARLEEADFADLFSDDTQARISSAEVDLQVGMRTMIDGLDYSLTGYQYTILCRGVTAQEDGSVAVDAMERSAQNFAQLPGITSERSRTFHRFVLEQRNGAWTIRSHMQYNALFGQLMDLAGGMAAEAPEAYLAAAESYLDTLQAARDALEAQRGEAGSLPDADVAYDREAALAYADQYAMTRNPDWVDYTGSGGNCQNYVSQCLLAGGIPMDTQGSAVWKWYDSAFSNAPTASGRSGSWASVTQFLTYASSNTGFGLAAAVDEPYFTGQPGDLLEMGTESGWRHTVIIRDLVTDDAGETVDYLINSNTNDMKNFPASLYGYPVVILTRIAGWNR